MKYTFALFVLFFPILIGAACDSESIRPTKAGDTVDQTNNAMSTIVNIEVKDKIFTATLFDNPGVTALKSMLPLTMNMTELNGNEKYFQLASNLPTNPSNPGTINTGDLMLWGSNTLVLFYESYSTSYSYRRLGKIDDPIGLATALGSGSVTITIKLH